MLPPKKHAGHPTGARRLDGALKDIATMAATLGVSEKKLRGDVARGLLPFHRFGGRIVFVEAEVLDFFRRLPGVTVSDALANQAVRRSSSTNLMKDETPAGVLAQG